MLFHLPVQSQTCEAECASDCLKLTNEKARLDLEQTKVLDVRLPTHLVPLKYTLELIPFIIRDNFTIRGNAEVSIINKSSVMMTILPD